MRGGNAHRWRFLLSVCLSALLALVALSAASAPDAADVPARGDDDGTGILRRAAKAAQNVSYTGVRSVATRVGSNGVTTERIEVVHRPGEGTRVSAAAGSRRLLLRSSPALLRLDTRALEILESNFRIVRGGSGVVCGRPVTVVKAVREDGTLAGRFWVDDATGLPMRKETRDRAGGVVHATVFATVEIGAAGSSGARADARAEPWDDVVSERERSRLRDAGWHLPERLSWDLRLLNARSTRESGRRVVHLVYSDGVSAVSVFVQRGRLSAESVGTSGGWQPVVVDGGTVYVSDTGQQRRVWESGGYVYTILANAPPAAVETAEERLPGPAEGVWPRVERGFLRMGSWLVG
ncbi:MucB/RseB-like sigma(E) regulatory protein [Haloactinospora alba]|uniref:MucB/RseB-like sigma(E) regulatory protein n=1 Tax=Haloactinospora alba TaxID=405555 RepID=A0A543NLS2_9ACTN|nr:sigma-E factor regulatory protein RseB domain-containing protein [Haloactinospora alba]TQN32754.1 MucB/RseB-like sigma(E) regulatory protein [Haloactinospora alba]